MVGSEWNLKGQCHEKVFKLKLWEFRLGPTDRPHPLLTSVNLLGSFKDDVVEVKRISSLCKTRMHVTLPY